MQTPNWNPDQTASLLPPALPCNRITAARRIISVLSKQGVAVRIHKEGKVTDRDELVAKGAKGGIIEE